MAVTVVQTTVQPAAGAPLTITGRILATAQEGLHRCIVGVKTTSGAPATFGAFAHMDNDTAELTQGSFWDTQVEQFQFSVAAGVVVASSDGYALSKYQRVDSNYVVGRYVWLALWNTNTTPAGSDVPDAVAGPYLIR